MPISLHALGPILNFDALQGTLRRSSSSTSRDGELDKFTREAIEILTERRKRELMEAAVGLAGVSVKAWRDAFYPLLKMRGSVGSMYKAVRDSRMMCRKGDRDNVFPRWKDKYVRCPVICLVVAS